MFTARWWVPVGVFALASAMVVLLGYTGRDDSHLTYFVADRLADGRGLVNLLGERQEQSSSLLFTLLLAGLSVLSRLPSATLGPFMSAALLLAAAVVSWRTAQRIGVWPLAGAAACLTPALFYWSLSGMEGSLYVLLLVWLVASLVDVGQEAAGTGRLTSTLCAAGLLTLTRPEGLVVLACLSVWLLVYPRAGDTRRAGAVVAGAGAAVALRLLAGLDLFPAPVYAKLQIGLLERMTSGAMYLARTAEQLPASTLLLACAVPVCIATLRRADPAVPRTRFAATSLVLAAIVAAFAVCAGGDWMEAGRFLAPVYAFVAFAGLCLVPARSVGRAVAVVLVASATDLVLVARQSYGGVPLYAAQRKPTTRYAPSGIERFNVVHARDLPFIDDLLGVLARDARPVLHVASIQGGVVPYYVTRVMGERVRVIDLYGLTSRRTQACVTHWQWDPYADLASFSRCLGTPIDYVFDLDDEVWSRVRRLTAQGCVEVLRDERTVRSVSWKAPLAVRQFLMRCDTPARPGLAPGT